MAKTFNVRVQNKLDSYQAWYDANPTLLAGEPSFITIPAETGAVKQEPAVLLKVGDGKTAWRDLPWLSAVAADVSDWAKADAKPSYNADEIGGLADFIGKEIQDTNTTYKLEQDEADPHILKLSAKELDGDWAVVASITTADTVYDDTDLKARVETLETKMNTIEEGAQVNILEGVQVNGADVTIDENKKVNIVVPTGALADKDIVSEGELDEALKAKINSTADADAISALTERVAVNEGAIGTLNGNAETVGSVDYKIAQAVAAIMENPDDTMNSINELVTWINDHAADALALSNQVTANKDDIAALEGLVGETGVADQITAAIEAALKIDGVDKYALATDLTAAIARIVALETKMATIAEGAQVNVIEKVKVNGVEVEVDGDKAVNITVPTGAMADKDEVAEEDLAADLAEKINAKANDADLHTVAKSGDIKDLDQTETIILYAGTATKVF